MNSSFLAGLILGFFGGVIGLYLGQSMMKPRHKTQLAQERQKEWDWLFLTYPGVMKQMQQDVNAPENGDIREFFVVDKSALMNSSIPRLRYDLSEEVLAVINKLEDLGYIHRLPNDSLLYEMDEDFVDALKK